MTIRAKLKKPQLPTPSDDGVGSVVLKGFTIPSGFVLHYTTNTGSEKSAKEGEHINSSHKFQEVKSGKVPGWSLQKVQSTYEFEVEEEETTVQFEDHTFTPWGDKATVLGVPVLSQSILRKMNTIGKLGGLSARYVNPEIVEYVSEIRSFLEDTYSTKPGMSDINVLDTLGTINRNINLLLSLEKTPYIKRLFDVSNPPDVTDPKLDEKLNPRNAERINLDSLSPELLKNLCAMSGITAEDLVSEISSGMTRAKFEEKYGQYIRVNSVKLDDLLVTKEEAKQLIEEAIRGIPEEVRPVVVTYLGGQDLVNQSIDEVISSLKEADYLFTDTMTQEELEGLSPKEDLDLNDLRKIKVEGYDLISGRFEILKRLLSPSTLFNLMRKGGEEDESSNQSVQDMVSEIIENYIEYLGGELHIYKTMMKDWISGQSGSYTKALMDWSGGANTPEVKAIRPTLEAIQSAHSDIYDTVTEGIAYRPLTLDMNSDVFNITEISVEVLSTLLSFTLDRELAEDFVREEGEGTRVLLTSKIPKGKIQFMPGLYMPKPYWKKVGGKPVYVNRDVVPRDEKVEVVVKSSSIVVLDHSSRDEYEEIKVVV